MRVRFLPTRSRYRDLTPGNIYRVIGIEADCYRLMNDKGEPFLHPPRLFEVVDPSEPSDWENSYGDEGERYAYAPPLGKQGFFEDYFDYKPRAIAALRSYLANAPASPRSRKPAAG